MTVILKNKIVVTPDLIMLVKSIKICVGWTFFDNLESMSRQGISDDTGSINTKKEKPDIVYKTKGFWRWKIKL